MYPLSARRTDYCSAPSKVSDSYILVDSMAPVQAFLRALTCLQASMLIDVNSIALPTEKRVGSLASVLASIRAMPALMRFSVFIRFDCVGTELGSFKSGQSWAARLTAVVELWFHLSNRRH